MRWLIAFLLAVSSTFAAADGPVYAEIQLAAGGVENNQLDFYPAFGSVNVGLYVVPNIGIELFADSGLRADRAGDFDLDMESAFGIAARFQSPPVQGIQGYIVLGAVNYTLDQSSRPTSDQPGTSVNDDFTGVRVSVGLLQRLRRAPGLQVSFEYRHYNADEPLRVDALVLGLRVNAR
ncbi:MAG: outer membrane beta-barrel protein [Granulosicoccus sp.]|nr:outer membrane beta-barrel protein [Granulosicoccus sp.]